MELSIRRQEKPIEARLLGRLAALAADLDDLEKSNQYLADGLKLSERLGEQELIGEQHYLLALNYQELANLDKAEEHAHKSAETYLASGAENPSLQASALLESLQTK